jgi:hypothetical protein
MNGLEPGIHTRIGGLIGLALEKRSGVGKVVADHPSLMSRRGGSLARVSEPQGRALWPIRKPALCAACVQPLTSNQIRMSQWITTPITM